MQEAKFKWVTLFKCATLKQNKSSWFDWKCHPKGVKYVQRTRLIEVHPFAFIIIWIYSRGKKRPQQSMILYQWSGIIACIDWKSFVPLTFQLFNFFFFKFLFLLTGVLFRSSLFRVVLLTLFCVNVCYSHSLMFMLSPSPGPLSLWPLLSPLQSDLLCHRCCRRCCRI